MEQILERYGVITEDIDIMQVKQDKMKDKKYIA